MHTTAGLIMLRIVCKVSLGVFEQPLSAAGQLSVPVIYIDDFATEQTHARHARTLD